MKIKNLKPQYKALLDAGVPAEQVRNLDETVSECVNAATRHDYAGSLFNFGWVLREVYENMADKAAWDDVLVALKAEVI